MQSNSQIEKPSGIQRKITITVPAGVVSQKFDRQLAEVQKKAKIKGFRPGHVPANLVREYYGSEVRSRVFEAVIDDSYRQALQEHKIRPIGQPKIEAKEAVAALDLTGKDFVYTATVEVMPEIQPKGYTGISLKKAKTEVSDEDVEKAIQGFLDQHAQLIPQENADRKAKKGDFVDFAFSGGIVTETGIEEKPGMKGSRVVEIGSSALIPGFEEEIIGCKKSETKTFQIEFPKDYEDESMSGKKAEFTITLNEIKEKKLPDLTDEFCKENGYESAADLKTKAQDALTKNLAESEDQRIRGELLQAIIEKNTFEVPEALLQAQVKAIADEVSQDLKSRGLNEAMIQQAIMQEFGNIQKRAENQVKAGLLLDAIAKEEKIDSTPEEYEAELLKMADNAKIEVAKVREFYEKNPSRKEGFIFRLLEDKTVRFLLSKAKIK